MQFSKKQLEEYILSEVKKLAEKEGWAKKPAKRNMDTSSVVFEETDKMTEEAEKVELKEVKMLAEEVKRMKDLVDFRSPLLRKENQ